MLTHNPGTARFGSSFFNVVQQVSPRRSVEHSAEVEHDLAHLLAGTQ